MYDGKQNPSIARGDGEPVEAYTGRMRDFVQQLEWRSDGHRFWYTHKNPHGCWICDLIFTIEQYRGCIESLVQQTNNDSTTDNRSDSVDETHELEDK